MAKLDRDFLSIHLAEHNVQSANNGHGVGQHVTARDFIHSRQVGESGRLDLASVRFRGAVGNDVHAKLALERKE